MSNAYALYHTICHYASKNQFHCIFYQIVYFDMISFKAIRVFFENIILYYTYLEEVVNALFYIQNYCSAECGAIASAYTDK